MKWFAIILLLVVSACGNRIDPKPRQDLPKETAAVKVLAAQSAMAGKGVEMHLIPIPKDKAQLDRLLAMGYTIHEDHMHPPGVKECPFDKTGGGVVE
jgi:hypothetical protein